MQILFDCPACLARNQATPGTDLKCRECDWSRPLPSSLAADGVPSQCLVCGCRDLWRQKDFPQGLGLTIVAIGIILSTIAWALTRPLWAIGILMGFALVDMLLYAWMRDVLVCYRCHARCRGTNPDEQHPRFNLELNERYRQEALRLEESIKPGT